MTRRASALGEIACFYALVLSAIWAGQLLSFRPPPVLAAVLLFGGCFWSNRRHGDSRESMGLDRRWLKPALLLTLKTIGLPIAALILWALMRPLPPWTRILFGERGLPPGAEGMSAPLLLALGLLRYPVWAVAQEYALLSFLANRWRDVLGERPWAVALANGALFGLVHAPNPILMSFSFLGGVAFTRIFLKTPHLLPPALAHALAGLTLSALFLHHPGAMMVGPAYWR